MDNTQVKMYGEPGPDGKWIKGIEDYLPNTQYLTAEHKQTVIEDIKENWLTLSHNGKFHAIFATSSIPEAIEYYRMMKTITAARFTKRTGLLKLSRITISAMGRILQYLPMHGLRRICRCVWRTRSSISALNAPPTNSLIC